MSEPFELMPLGGHRWTLVRMSKRGIAHHGVFLSPAEAAEHAKSLGEEVLESSQEDKITSAGETE